MLERLRKKLRFLRRGSRGSAIIVVLVTMTFVVVLASTLLYLSLVNIQMKTLDKGSKSNFYSAESVMNEIRAGIQTGVSDAIKEAYSDVLVSYNTQSKDAQTEHFINKFYEELYQTEVASEPLFYDEGAYYDDALLMNFVSEQDGAAVSGSGTVARSTDDLGTVTSIAMKGIVVTYTAGGYETAISSDIRIATPPLPYTSTTITQTPAPGFAVIARGGLLQPPGAGTVGIGGSVCAGGLTIGGSGDTFNVVNAENFVLAGPVEITGGALSFNINSNLWATNIMLDLSGSITLLGDAYIANDLNLYGSGTQAVLSGRYFGYGNGFDETDPPPDAVPDPNLSSAILINGRETLLDMSALRALMLAGHSFINYDTSPDPLINSCVMMGESISVKTNQLAYLIPDECLGGAVTNPWEYDAANPPSPDELCAAVLLDQEFLNGKSLSDYGITSAAENIHYIRKTVPTTPETTNLIYFCMKFTDRVVEDRNYTAEELANAYFKDYYNTHGPTTVQKYVDLYSDGIILKSTATKNLAGEAFTFDGSTGTLGPIIDAYGVPLASISGIAASYANLCVTLSTADSGGGASNAYDYFVDSAQLNDVTGTRLYPLDEDTKKAVVVHGDYTIDYDPLNPDRTPDTVHLIIASGSVTVNGPFTGLIFAGGDVTLYDTVTTDSALASDALGALSGDDDGDGVYTYYFLNPEHISPLNSSTADDDVNGWNLNVLVNYQNWKKNET